MKTIKFLLYHKIDNSDQTEFLKITTLKNDFDTGICFYGSDFSIEIWEKYATAMRISAVAIGSDGSCDGRWFNQKTGKLQAFREKIFSTLEKNGFVRVYRNKETNPEIFEFVWKENDDDNPQK